MPSASPPLLATGGFRLAADARVLAARGKGFRGLSFKLTDDDCQLHPNLDLHRRLAI